MLPERALIDSKRDDSVDGELLCSLMNEPASVCLILRFLRDWELWLLCKSGLVVAGGDGRDSDMALSGSSSSMMGSRGLIASISYFPDESLPCDGGRPARDLAVVRTLPLDDDVDEG